MNYIIIEKYLLEDLQDILLRSNYSILVEKIENSEKLKVTFIGGKENDKETK